MSKVCQPTQSGCDPVDVLLARIVRETLRVSLIGSAALAAGCSGSDGQEQTSGAVRVSKGSDADAMTQAEAVPAGSVDTCARGSGFPVQAAGLKLQEPSDYVAVRQISNVNASVASGTWPRLDFTVISETGTPCATATTAACGEKVIGHPADLSVQDCQSRGCYEFSVVTTRGDDVERAATPDALLSLLGEIDSPDEAIMLAASHSYEVRCTASAGSPIGSIWPGTRWIRDVPGGYELVATRYAETCPVIVRRILLFVGSYGEVEELDQQDFTSPPDRKACIGRTPAGLTPRVALRSKNALGEHLAACAHLEAASVHAFVRLADELCGHGAPRELVERALSAAEDETRHARVVSALARYHHGELTTPEVKPLAARALEEIARENAVEGCVRETFGALVGAHQAARAADPYLRDALITIAVDEARHAALSHDVDAWLMSRLSEAAQRRVRQAQRRAIDELFVASAHEPEPLLQHAAGLPSAQISQQLLRELARELWLAMA